MAKPVVQLDALRGIHAEVQTITPELAGDWLARPGANRRMSTTIVNRYADAMVRGEWKITGEPIILSPDGRLLDGQHRLAAVVQSGTTIESMVVTGVHDDAFTQMNSGKSRTQADVVSIAGYTNANRVSALARAIIAYEWYGDMNLAKQRKSRVAPSNEQVLARVTAESEILYACLNRTSGPTMRSLGLKKTVGSVLYYLFRNIDHEDAEAFYGKLESGAGLQEADPILTLRQRLLANAGGVSKLPDDYIAAITIKAWNYWRAGREIRQLSWKPGGSVQEPFPRPE